MNKATLQRYQFATDAQWNSCLAAEADRDASGKDSGFRPFASYDRDPVLYKSAGAHGPAISPGGVILWRDDAGCLQRLSPYCEKPAETGAATTHYSYDDAPEQLRSPAAIAAATRLVATVADLWAIDPLQTIHRYELETLTNLVSVDVPSAQVIDLADGNRETVFALVERPAKNPTLHILHFDSDGRVLKDVEITGISDGQKFAFLKRSRQFVVLTGEKRSRLCWFHEDGGDPEFSLTVGALRPCFSAITLSSDANDRLLLAGVDRRDFGGRTYVVVLDKDGNRLDQIPINAGDTPVTGIAGGRNEFVITGPRGLLRFRVADVIPDSAGEVRSIVITPLLYSPDRSDARGWLRADVSARLLEGATLAIAVASTDDNAVRSRLQAMTSDVRLSESERAKILLNEPGIRREATVFHGRPFDPEEPDAIYSAPLFGIQQQYIWVSLTLSAAPRSALPSISKMAVLYPNLGLVDELPAIYQRADQSFLRSLVGVVEASTQQLDTRIASMGSLVNPITAPVDWMDFVARWLGVPWDDALNSEQKNNLIRHAADLVRQRGTRAGLETLLQCLMPGSPQPFRVTDATADFGFAIVGDDSCPGTTLPAMLGGSTRWNTPLNERSVLGYMRLPCVGQSDDPARGSAGKIRIQVAATAEQRKAWEPWFYRLISEMVPLTATLKLDWVSARALRGDRLDSSLVLESEHAPYLGMDAITGLARLPEGKNRLSPCGGGTRLQ
jgi:phage tail-like protein